MIEKFNFYDIYGYFLPGAALLTVLWLPFVVVRHTWPSSSLESAIIAAAIAYILGHLLQTVATDVIPSKEKDKSGKKRYPSEILLDADDSELPTDAKNNLSEFVNAQFKLDLYVKQNHDNQKGDAPQADQLDQEDIDKIRNVAFLLARQVLIQGKVVNYAEQFQGMYALTRGLVAVLMFGFFYLAGWSANIFRSSGAVRAAVVLIALGVIVMINISIIQIRRLLDSKPKSASTKEQRREEQRKERKRKRIAEWTYAGGLFAASTAIGYCAALNYAIPQRTSAVLATLAVLALVTCLRIYMKYQFYARRFASTVWRDYLAYKTATTKEVAEELHV